MKKKEEFKQKVIMNNNELYHKIDEDENLSDSEKREIYYSEIEKMYDENGW